MSLYILPKERLPGFVESLRTGFRVVGPVRTETGYAFDEIRSVDEMVLDYPTTTLPPKKYLLPQREVLFRFHSETGENGARRLDVQPVFDGVEPTVIFGVHSCDMHGIMLYDKVFSEGYKDEHYLKRREQMVIVGIECLRPCDDASFCKDMGTLTAPPVYDLHMTAVDDDYLIDARTEKGERLLLDYGEAHLATTDDIRRLSQTLSAKWPNFRLRLKMTKDQLPSLMTISYGSHLWDTLGEKCLACGSCTNVCPTCFCFDVQDEVELNMTDGERARIWDSCQLHEFALVAGGHNFRASKASRVRHRMMRKGKYIQQVHNITGCTGCGRCQRACLAGITVPGTFNALYDEIQIDVKPVGGA